MSYFSDQYRALKYPIADERHAGFRPAQLAAMHAVSAHFFNSKQPAIVTMPTGSGKTTVLMAVTFLLRAHRVLVLTPSRLVREQIAENFRALADLKKTEAVAIELPTPRVFATDRMIETEVQWARLREFDVVVATVPSVSQEGVIPDPPADLFDVVLVDEAHHAPARTWSRLLDLLGVHRHAISTR
jgi:superfamily II DNA or RNA helicase